MRFNSKGQAFDVFKLLIAAVIAIAMLAILLPIVKNLLPPGYSDPTSEAENLIKNNIKYPSNYSESKEVVFTTEKNLNAKAIAGAGDVLNSNQLCLSKGDFEEDQDFELQEASNNVILRYKGSTQRAKIGVICDDGESLSTDLQDYAQNVGASYDMTCVGGEPSGAKTYCVLILRYV